MADPITCVHLYIKVHSCPCYGQFNLPELPSISATKSTSPPASNENSEGMTILKRAIRRMRGRERLREEVELLVEEAPSSKSSASEVISVKSTPRIETPDSHDNLNAFVSQRQRQQQQQRPDILDEAVPTSPVSLLGDTNKSLPTVPSSPITRPSFIPASALQGVERSYVEDSNGRLSTPTSPDLSNNPSSPLPPHQRHNGGRPNTVINTGDVHRPSIIVNASSNSAGRSSIVINASNSDLDLILRALESICLDLTTSHSPHPNTAEIAQLEPMPSPVPPPTSTSPAHMQLGQVERAWQVAIEQQQQQQQQQRRRASNAESPLESPPLGFQRPSSLVDEMAQREWTTRQLQMQQMQHAQQHARPVSLGSQTRVQSGSGGGGSGNGGGSATSNNGAVIPRQPDDGSAQTPPLPLLADQVARRQWIDRQFEQLTPPLPIPRRGSSLGTRILKRN